MSHRESMRDLYTHLRAAHGEELAELDESLNPRAWEFLYDEAASTGLTARSVVADAGCGAANHTAEIKRRLACRVIGIDPVAPPATPGVELVQGTLECLPLAAESVDLIWCRDVLVHVRDLDAALGECARVLRPGGHMLVYTTAETEWMDPGEAFRIYQPLLIAPLSMSRPRLEQALARAGFTVLKKEDLGAELVEFHEERDGRVSRVLLRLPRMRRRRQEAIARWGEERYAAIYALYEWTAYMLLGKLAGVFYLLQKTRQV